ncbi:hypothetical protein A2631_00280 [Candidatus Daviesbacteria bacterium RIFCSPHIGHO2_01_FULL_44_29]|uniref:Mannosyl-glycoprotein endo-beta-N-acetylglucosamidase-like domain-containing protein n=1 Tax=Candidatus Daviesbacteria bacterium RIFCSPHIGHO2_02_FULL_43_12 TaxID=1797776 RepID=A0A1F5KFQ3_9BACT|nr:MAG: hypothetical protein A2631_00280 [Candidatus Daviesbacteria bacterium RIFCSPHIGHO2_01_FULL_44_29]OGE38877.1 MAG: hypothetical protein A3E86_03120 [Candidatus Daviesbacteria bacterium RIFCSPHIGHO2_12_FULL_47_45]OGE39776.1 MAG: hypothetical protein A3D25_03560 [Candidatus Daviesbacteria bacterium RIFCSPHIGHO2_02_FULL_43_12]OGE69933.1 MAG: hypothetical protein A3B55_04525 [Candidatus Daviesbacteria bacterium RIFCSPLOWO2_01_FULL_43_15]
MLKINKALKVSIFHRFLFLGLVIPFLFNTTKVVAEAHRIQQPTQEMRVEVKEIDQRALILRDYFAKFNSPLQAHAMDFIDAADTYQLDWKLIPAITGVESTFGKFVPGGTDPNFTSHNGWGWGVYGTQAIYFKSWREGIFTVAEGLKKNYIDKGLTTPFTINPKYAASKAWGGHVEFFLRDLNEFAASYNHFSMEAATPAADKLPVIHANVENKTAGISAKLALRIP